MRTFLIAVFYAIITPLALLLRFVFRHDPLERAFDSRASTYRRRSQPRDARHLFRQY
jgi:hypothetical protein